MSISDIPQKSLKSLDFEGDLPDEPEDVEVWVHHLQDILMSQEYAVSSIFTKYIMEFRILDENGWHTSDYYERGVLNAVFAQLHREILAPYTRYPVRGMYYKGHLRIVDRAHEKGHQINTLPVNEILEYFKAFEVAPPKQIKRWDRVFENKGGIPGLTRQQAFEMLADKMRERGALYDFNI